MVLAEVVMTVTYKPMPMFPQIKMPVLHKVVYGQTIDAVQAQYQRSYRDHLVDSWLSSHCRHPYYHSPGYLTEKFIQFECSHEALAFALKWAK